MAKRYYAQKDIENIRISSNAIFQKFAFLRNVIITPDVRYSRASA